MDLTYWYNHTSMLGFAWIIREHLPWYMRFFTKVYACEKQLDNRNKVIRVYYSYESFSDVKNRFCYEFTLNDFIQASNGDKTITNKVFNKSKLGGKQYEI